MNSLRDIRKGIALSLFSSTILWGLISVLITTVACRTQYPIASMNDGTIIQQKGNYGVVAFRSAQDTASYNTLINLYFHDGIKENEQVIVVRKTYLDSLIRHYKRRP